MLASRRMAIEHSTLARTLSLAVHELRTPVTVVNGYLRMVLKGQAGPLSEKQQKMLEEAERSCERIGALVAQMSDVGKLETGELTLTRQDIDLTGLLAEVASDMPEGVDRGVHVEVRGTHQPRIVAGDRVRLAAAVRALLYVALRERAVPGVVIVDCSVVADPEPSVVIAVGDEDTVRSLAHSSSSASPFDEWRGGVGLALPLARRIITAHGGSVWSAAGESRKGSAIRLPLKTT